jgi:hypothetical protein
MKCCAIYQFCKKILYTINPRKQKKQKIFILEDQYTPKIAKELLEMNPNLDIPIVENVFQPMDFLEKISDNDIILLDNYFKTK